MNHEPSNLPPILLYDGVCGLCNAALRWLIARDRRRVLRFASLQSRAGRELLRAAGSDPEAGRALDSVVMLVDGRAHFRSDAVLVALAQLGLPWALAGIARVLPRVLRDALYGVVARRRYVWFGRLEACPRPVPGARERFLDAEEADAGAH